MTTIATDGKSMAADSRCGGETFHTEVMKIHRATDGALLGCCGQAFDIAGFVAWYRDGMSGLLNVNPEFEGLILEPDGTVLCVDEKGRYFTHGVPAVVGSGCRFAYGALDAGASPQEAVAIAAKRDSFTGGTIHVEYLKPPLKEVA